jgi:hypothetical protein
MSITRQSTRSLRVTLRLEIANALQDVQTAMVLILPVFYNAQLVQWQTLGQDLSLNLLVSKLRKLGLLEIACGSWKLLSSALFLEKTRRNRRVLLLRPLNQQAHLKQPILNPRIK